MDYGMIAFHSVILGAVGWALKEIYHIRGCVSRIDGSKKDK